MKHKHRLLPLLGFTTALISIILLRNYNRGNSIFSLLLSIPYYDKIGHFFLMGILAFIAVVTFVPVMPDRSHKSTMLVLTIVLAFIALEECSQIFIPTRTFSYRDFICDLLGVFCFGSLGHSLVNKTS